jgi:hypothetical protein
MIEVKTRSEASWGILSSLEDTRFHNIINERRWPVTYRIDQVYHTEINNLKDCEK